MYNMMCVCIYINICMYAFMHVRIYRCVFHGMIQDIIHVHTHTHTHTRATHQALYDDDGLLLSNIRDRYGNLVPAATDEFFRKKFAEFQHMHIVQDPEEVRAVLLWCA
jgi:hypothetical protein